MRHAIIIIIIIRIIIIIIIIIIVPDVNLYIINVLYTGICQKESERNENFTLLHNGTVWYNIIIYLFQSLSTAADTNTRTSYTIQCAHTILIASRFMSTIYL